MFSIYKKGQGKLTRLGSVIGLIVVSAAGCYKLYDKLSGLSISNLRKDMVFLISVMVPALIFAITSALFLLLVNRPSVADFMISAEGEIKKVSWSSKKEIAVSTFIVIVVMALMATILGLTDFIFGVIFDTILMPK